MLTTCVIPLRVKPTFVINKVKVTDSSQDIAEAIVKLSIKMKSQSCSSCFANSQTDPDCSNCMTAWYDSRNAIIKVLRNIFSLPVNKDVPKPIFHLASKEAENIEYSNITPSFINGINRLKIMHKKDLLIKMVPGNVTCNSCKKEVPKSRFGYIIGGDEPVCWECEMKRCNTEEKGD